MGFFFRPLCHGDMPLLHQWYNMPAIQRFYSLRDWTLEEVAAKHRPMLEGSRPVWGFIAEHDGAAIGYLQHYNWCDFPYPDLMLAPEITAEAAGIDFFIGSSMHLGRGLGAAMVEAFIQQQLTSRYSYIIADPAVGNEASIRTLRRCGFHPRGTIASTNALGSPDQFNLMIRPPHPLSDTAGSSIPNE